MIVRRQRIGDDGERRATLCLLYGWRRASAVRALPCCQNRMFMFIVRLVVPLRGFTRRCKGRSCELLLLVAPPLLLVVRPSEVPALDGVGIVH